MPVSLNCLLTLVFYSLFNLFTHETINKFEVILYTNKFL